MNALDALAEERIREALERGELDGLPGSGRPLDLDDDALVPEELRVAYRVLRNAGFVPPELEAHRELRDVEALLRAAAGEVERAGLLARIDFLLSRTAAGRRHGSLRVQEEAYLQRITARLTISSS
jgi:hypothetical protein